MLPLSLTSLLVAFAAWPAVSPGDGPPAEVRGITISCQTWGWEWGQREALAREVEDLAALGANWIAIHPYARIAGDGGVGFRSLDPDEPPARLRVPLEVARDHGFGLLVKPHLAYWGSPFAWRGAIDFDEPAARERFFREYGRWIVELARATRGVDAFAVGTELDRLVEHEEAWRRLIAEVRAVTDARLTYAANWDSLERVPFWDALDAVGVQAYFPLTEAADPDETQLRTAWEDVLVRLRRVHAATGKPVVFTEFGYNRSLSAASQPWAYATAHGAEGERAEALQARCLRVGLEVLRRERDWLRGAFLWKWFVGEPGWNDTNFFLDTPPLRSVLRRTWAE